MSYVNALYRGARRVALTQAGLTLACAAGFGLVGGGRSALAALYGGLVTILVTGWLAWRLGRTRDLARNPSAAWAAIYSSAIVRYAAVMVLVGAGVAVLKLPAVPLLTAFAVTQFGFLANLRRG